MILSYLNEFVVLAQVCKYHEASELLYISTSSLSKHIRALENELGKPLFKRISRLVELTRFGSDFLPYAMKMVELQREYTDKLLARPEENENVITIGVSFKVTVYNLMTLMPTLKKSNPNHRIQIIEQEARQLTAMLKKDEVDMVITEFYEGIDVGNSGEIQAERFLADRLIVVLPANHRLAGRDCVAIEELKDDPYIHLGNMLNGNTLNFNSEVLRAPTIMVSHCAQAINFVEEGFGISILPKTAAMSFKTDAVVFVDLDVSPQISIFLLYKKENSGRSAIRAVLEYLRIRSTSISEKENLPGEGPSRS